MERVWRKLPSDVLEEVVTFLPLASLCRFRAVSKTWNKFTSHPNFASRHAQASSPEEYILIRKWDIDRERSPQGWQVMDVASKRFFYLSDDFLDKFIKQEGIFAHCPQAHLHSSPWKTILAADGGLLCLLYSIKHGNELHFCDVETHEVLLVCNPVLKTVKQLPHFAGWSRRPPWIVMLTNRNSMEYEIYFIVTYPSNALQSIAAYIYESKTSSWRASAVVQGHHNAISGQYLSCYASVIFKDEFYTFYVDYYKRLARLVSYNKVTGAVSDLGMDVPYGSNGDYHKSLQLVVNDGRLFCVIINMGHVGMARIKQVSSIEIVECIVARREYIHLSRLEGNMVDSFLGNRIQDQYNYTDHALAIATGLTNSIFFCSYIGRSQVYNLLEKTWYKFPDNCHSWCNRCSCIEHKILLLGGNHCLSLCAL